ncbi:hypothetical protein [Flavobacterium sp. UMI-01]|uniref:hypothetical protein n=1 Tax=Flavobacterium sp. UMI-01 TaxID=1441053 RepID=UPI001C7D525C|nr:hypothetical protein [Flavobacterium sp. UMI-01]GIZ10055.1 hypothetical protein FUMI01_27810 [Flavobacterium sp. UMI-01]
MKKIPGQGGFTKKLTTEISKWHRKKFANEVSQNLPILLIKINQKKRIPMEVASFSSCNDYQEQLLSILSFVRYVGIPIKWTLYSDGSHTAAQIAQLEDHFDFLKVKKGIPWNTIKTLKGLCKEALEDYEEYLIDYAKKFPLGKKLFYYLNHTIENPTLFIDSDILFYEQAKVVELFLTERPQATGWFMPDTNWGCLDSRYKAIYSEQVYQVNSGFIFANVPFQHLEKALEILKIYDFSYEYFSEQTIYHQLLKDNSFMPLPPKTFVLDAGDQFDFSYLFTPKQMAVRHYTGPVRHKMWQKKYKWHLSL